MTINVWITAGVAGVCCGLVTIFLIRLLILVGFRRGWLDYPDTRKRHTRPVPPLGGVAIFPAFWGTILVVSLLQPSFMTAFAPEAPAVFVGAAAIFLLGLWDDFRPIGAGGKLMVQLLVGFWLWQNGLRIDQLWIPMHGGLELGLAGLPLTLLWFILIVNAVNIIDGLDALAGGVALIGLASILVIAVHAAVTDLVILALGLAGALVGFLVFNRPPAKIFLGDSGSLSLGYVFAALALWLPLKRYTVVAVYVPVLAVLVPLAESAWSILRRVGGRQIPTASDRGHLHFRLLEYGLTENQVRALFYTLAGVGFFFSVAVAYGNRRLWMVVFGIFVLLLIVGLYIFMRVSRRGTRKKRD